MLVYYSGFDKNGEKFSRLDEFISLDDLFDVSEKSGEEIIQFVELPGLLGVLRQLGTKKLKNKEVVEFCYHIATFLDGGVDLSSIFNEIKFEPVTPFMQKIIKKIAKSIAEGDSLSLAFQRTKAFPVIVVTLLEIGESSGNISQSLKDAAMYLEREIELRSSTYRALIYPGFTFSIMLVGLVFWIVFVIPQVVRLIETMDVELPIQTQMLVAGSDYIHQYWDWGLMIISLFIILFFLAGKIPFFRYYIDKCWWYMPITGKVVASSQMAFYFNYFKVLYDAGVPVSTILTKLQQTVSSHFFRERILAGNSSIREGDTLQGGYEKSKVYEAIAIRVIGIGEKTGNLDKQLALLSGLYHKRVAVFVQTLPKVLEPVFISFIGIFFVLFASTLLGPLYEVIISIGVDF